MKRLLELYEARQIEKLIRLSDAMQRVRAIIGAYDRCVALNYRNITRLAEWHEELGVIQRCYRKTRNRIHLVNRWMEFWE